MKALITGSRGFVGAYLRRELEEHGYTVTGLDIAWMIKRWPWISARRSRCVKQSGSRSRM